MAKRNDKGQLLPGEILNPTGRPKGSKHMTTLLLDAIVKVAKDKGTSEDSLMVKALIDKAKTGDTKALEMVFDRIDGKVPNKVELEADIRTESTEELKALTKQLNDLHRGTSKRSDGAITSSVDNQAPDKE